MLLQLTWLGLFRIAGRGRGSTIRLAIRFHTICERITTGIELRSEFGARVRVRVRVWIARVRLG